MSETTQTITGLILLALLVLMPFYFIFSGFVISGIITEVVNVLLLRSIYYNLR